MPLPIIESFTELDQKIIGCHLCPRLVEYREHVPAKKAFQNQPYWRKPVPGFGDMEAALLITGLAPAAHGGNRTGRVFTGDQSGDFLMKALYLTGFANQPSSTSLADNLELTGCYITAAVKCVPPQDKPNREEILTCNRYYQNELYLLKNIKCVMALGQIAFDAFLISNNISPKPKFEFGKKYLFPNLPPLWASYHPSPRNTNTGTLTLEMFVELVQRIKKEAGL